MATIKNVVVVGATGNVGLGILTALKSNPSFNVSILTRTTSSSISNPPPNTKVLTADYSSVDSLATAFAGQDAVVSAVGFAAIPSQTVLVDAAIKAGVKRFIPADFGTDPLHEKTKNNPIFAGKNAVKDYLETKAAEGKIEWTILANGPFFDWGLKTGFLGYNIAERKVTLYDNGTTQFATSTFADISHAVASILLKPEETKNRVVYIYSTVTTQLELLAIYEKLTDTKWEVERKDITELEKIGNEGIAQGDWQKAGLLIYKAIFAEGHGNDFKGKENNKLLGIEPLSKEQLEEAVKATL